MSDANSAYYEQRRRQCLQSAESAADSAVARVHRNFAAHYRTAARQAAREEAATGEEPR